MASSLYNKVSRIQQMKNAKIKAENLRSGVNVFGVNGTYTSDANANGNDLAMNKTAYVNGTRIGGALAVYDATTRNIPWGSIKDDFTNQCLRINYSNTVNLNTRPNYHTNCGNAAIYNGAYMEIGYSNLAKTIGLDALTLKKDVTVLGVTGQYDASTEFAGIKMDPIIASNSAISLTSSITEVSGLDMTQGTNLAFYFNSLYGLRSLSNLSAPNVTNLYAFCNYDNRLQKIEYVNFYNEEQSAVNCSYMFNNCNSLKEIPNNVIFPKSIQNCWFMFTNCSQLETINTPLNFSVANTSSLFSNCISLVNISNITMPVNVDATVSSMFMNCYELDVANINLKGIKITNRGGSILANTKYSTRANLQKFFANINSAWVNGGLLTKTALESVDCDLWTDIPQLKCNSNLSAAFTYCNKLTSVNLYKSSYTTLASTFQYCTNLTDVNITTPDIGFTDMPNAFQSCANLMNFNMNVNQKLKSLSNTFCHCYNLTNINFNNSFNQSTLIGMYYTFMNCYNLRKFEVNALGGPSNMYHAFCHCSNLETVRFNASNPWYTTVTNFHYTFYNCSNLTTIDDERDIALKTTVTQSGTFFNCSNLNINSLNYYIGDSATFSNMIGIITNNPYITKMDLTLKGSVSNTYGGTSFNYLISNCTGLKYANVTLEDKSGNTNTWYTMQVINNCPNLDTVYYNCMTYSTRAIYGYPLSYCNVNNLYLNLGRDLNKTQAVNVSLISTYVNNFDLNINAKYALFYFHNSQWNNMNINAPYLEGITSYGISSLNSNKDIDVNFSNINSLGGISLSQINQVPNINLNFGKAANINSNPSITMYQCNDVKNLNVNISNIPQVYQLYLNQFYNVEKVNFNLNSLTNTGYTFQVHTLPMCTDLNLSMPNMNHVNYTFSIYNCASLVNLDLGFSSNLNILYEFRIDNMPRLQTIKMDYANISNVYINGYVIINRCPNLTDQTIDNLFGMLSKLKYIGTKYINYSFRNCNLSQARAQNLANYNNLISAGWTY